jgi:hypothetical protein
MAKGICDEDKPRQSAELDGDENAFTSSACDELKRFTDAHKPVCTRASTVLTRRSQYEHLRRRDQQVANAGLRRAMKLSALLFEHTRPLSPEIGSFRSPRALLPSPAVSCANSNRVIHTSVRRNDKHAIRSSTESRPIMQLTLPHPSSAPSAERSAASRAGQGEITQTEICKWRTCFRSSLRLAISAALSSFDWPVPGEGAGDVTREIAGDGEGEGDRTGGFGDSVAGFDGTFLAGVTDTVGIVNVGGGGAPHGSISGAEWFPSKPPHSLSERLSTSAPPDDKSPDDKTHRHTGLHHRTH